MDRIRKISLVTTICDLVFVVISLLGFAFLVAAGGVMSKLVGDSVNYMTDVDGNSVIAGYQVLGGLAGTFLFGFGFFVAIALGIMLAIFAAMLIAGVVLGFVARSKRDNIGYYKADSIVKIVCNAIPALITVTSVVGARFSLFNLMIGIIGLVFLLVEGLSIYNLVNVSKLR